jgi:phosphoribosyl 1,2-cyclic phosphodiesterase
MKATIWGARGSVPSPGPDTQRYGGNTACVEVLGSDGTLLILDAGTGIRRLGETVCCSFRRIDIFLTHLHLDHIQGLGFFAPLYDPKAELHIWGPASTTQDLRTRLIRYLSPPLFPIHMRELPNLIFHEVPNGRIQLGEFEVKCQLVCHPGPTVGYRIESPAGSLAYLPDHEPTIGSEWPSDPHWLSGYELAKSADVLIHDAQFSPEAYQKRIGWGHSSLNDAMRFADIVGAAKLVTFHYDPSDDDSEVDVLIERAVREVRPQCQVVAGYEGLEIDIPGARPVRLAG